MVRLHLKEKKGRWFLEWLPRQPLWSRSFILAWGVAIGMHLIGYLLFTINVPKEEGVVAIYPIRVHTSLPETIADPGSNSRNSASLPLIPCPSASSFSPELPTDEWFITHLSLPTISSPFPSFRLRFLEGFEGYLPISLPKAESKMLESFNGWIVFSFFVRVDHRSGRIYLAKTDGKGERKWTKKAEAILDHLRWERKDRWGETRGRIEIAFLRDLL